MRSIFNSKEIDAILETFYESADTEASCGVGFAEDLFDAIREKLRKDGKSFWVPDFGTFRRNGDKVEFEPEGEWGLLGEEWTEVPE